MRFLVLGAALLAALLVAAGCTTPPPANPTVTPTAAQPAVYLVNDSGRTVPLGVGQGLTIRLPENPTTGYAWNASVTDGLLIVDSAYTPDPHPTNMVGVGGTRTWTVRGVRAGTQQFDAVYVRPFDPELPAGEFNLTVQVG